MPSSSGVSSSSPEIIFPLNRRLAGRETVIAVTLLLATGAIPTKAAVVLTNLSANPVTTTDVLPDPLYTGKYYQPGGIYLDFVDQTTASTGAAPVNGPTNWSVHLFSSTYTTHNDTYAELPQIFDSNGNAAGQYADIVYSNSKGAVLTPGTVVGPSSTFGTNRRGVLDTHSTGTDTSNWLAGTSGYLGVEFLDSSSLIHYGWIAMSLGSTYPESITVTGFAYESTPGVAITIPELPGDANLDGVVNFSDFVILSNDFGSSNVGFTGGDFNGDGIVNFSDFVILSNNFGATGNGFSQSESADDLTALDNFAVTVSVPEPASIGLLALGGLAFISRRRRPTR